VFDTTQRNIQGQITMPNGDRLEGIFDGRLADGDVTVTTAKFTKCQKSAINDM
jgi:hypothetical protein